MARKCKSLSGKQVTELKNMLLSEKSRILEKHKKADNGNFCLDKNELSDPLDEASINTETQKMLRFRSRERYYLKKIEKTLERISLNTFGLCEECDSEISYERLLARPTAELCISCKEEAEMIEKNNFFQKKSKSLGHTLQDLRRE